eukprot:6176913-Pleurochrysis_carterae.AAC.8
MPALRTSQAAMPTMQQTTPALRAPQAANANDGEDGADGGIPKYELRETPRRKRMRELATAGLERQAGEMQKSVLRKNKAPALCNSLSDVYRSRVDAVNVTLVVVEQVKVGENSKEVKYRLACKAGVLKPLYGRSDVRALVEQTPLAQPWIGEHVAGLT